MSKDKEVSLECNHGKQVGIYCECDEGWQSTGLHEEHGQFVYSWCNAPEEVPYNIEAEPRIFTKSEEVTFCIVSLTYTVKSVTRLKIRTLHNPHTELWSQIMVNHISLENQGLTYSQSQGVHNTPVHFVDINSSKHF